MKSKQLRRRDGREMSLDPNGESYFVTISIITAAKTEGRLNSLKRLMNSLLKSQYPDSAYIPLRISVDSDACKETFEYVTRLVWPYGPKVINRRVKKGGLVAAVAESFFPSSPLDHGVLLEDDIEVSRHWFQYVTSVLDLHYKDPDLRIIGISLYNPRTIEVIASRGKFVRFDSTAITEQPLYAHQVPCSWGALWFPEPWKDFLSYLTERLVSDPHGRNPMTLPGSNTMRWKLSWKKFMIEMMYIRDWYVVYPSFKDQTSFATNHVEIGEHIKDKRSQKRFTPGFTVPLFDEETFHALSPLSSLPESIAAVPFLDIFGRAVISPTNALSLGANVPPSTSWDPPSAIEENSGFDPACSSMIRDEEFSFFFPQSLLRSGQSITLHLLNSPNLLSQLHHYGSSPSVTQIVVSHLDTSTPPPPDLRVLSTSVTFLVHDDPRMLSIFSPSSKASSTSHILFIPPEALVAHKDLALLSSVSEIYPKAVLSFSPITSVPPPTQFASASYTYVTAPFLVPSEYILRYMCDNPSKQEVRSVVYAHGFSCMLASILLSMSLEPLVVRPIKKIKRYQTNTEATFGTGFPSDKCISRLKEILPETKFVVQKKYIEVEENVKGELLISPRDFPTEWSHPFVEIDTSFPKLPAPTSYVAKPQVVYAAESSTNVLKNVKHYVVTLDGVPSAPKENKGRLEAFRSSWEGCGIEFEVCTGTMMSQQGAGLTETISRCLSNAYDSGADAVFFYEDDALLFGESFCDEGYRKELLSSTPDDALLLFTGAHDFWIDQRKLDQTFGGQPKTFSRGKIEYLPLLQSFGTYGFAMHRNKMQRVISLLDSEFKECTEQGRKCSPDLCIYQFDEDKEGIYVVNPLIVDHKRGTYSNSWKKFRKETQNGETWMGKRNVRDMLAKKLVKKWKSTKG
eukprot:CAMPEP_0118637144 /NCGR_PEP_ID=MMETSP0785-20121206/2998_1 /TAXON_ID=91992 /ORGANISM="Bolidomonas pacifica, Strain CCMP 1866" /LENGTH=908 /DNA_ID=CAMNT_0006528315 /DNA_START=219 /DNA_END=2942 /DNA_ORIENTATION=-